MLPHPTFLSTAYPSEGISDEAHAVVWGIYVIAIACALIGFVMRVQGSWSPSTERKLAAAIILLGLLPLAWHLNIYRIDYFPHEMDGTPASPPIWKAMTVPSLPFLIGIIQLLLIRRARA